MWGDSISRCFKTYLIVWFIKCTNCISCSLVSSHAGKKRGRERVQPHFSGKWQIHQNPGHPRARPCPGPEAHVNAVCDLTASHQRTWQWPLLLPWEASGLSPTVLPSNLGVRGPGAAGWPHGEGAVVCLRSSGGGECRA